MSFNTYPDPQIAPLPLAAGASMPAFEQLAGHVGPGEAGLNTTFIRISMSGATSSAHPQVELKAVHPTLTEGLPKTIIETSLSTAQGLLDGTNDTTAASAYWAPPYSNNVYLLRVIISIVGTTLKIKITNDTSVARDFVWVVADSDADSLQPWIHVTPAALTYTALVNQAANLTAQSLQITNRGTGPLTVTSVTPSIAAPYTISGLPVTRDPNPATPASVSIGFTAPSAIGDTPLANFAFDGDPGTVFGTGHNRGFSLSATTSKLEIALALDDSGSMGWAPDGTHPVPLASSRWSELQSAAKLFLELLGGFGENKGTFGIVKFPGRPDRPINDVTSYDFDLTATAKPIPSASGMSGTKTQIDGTSPFYQGTPMYYALERLLNVTLPYFAIDGDSINMNRRWILLMSDGAWNSSPDPRGKISDLAAANIKVYAAGYGTAMEVDYPTLQALSTGPGTTPDGMSLQVDVGGYTATALAGAFKTAIKAGLTSVSSPSDPSNILYAGDAEARHPIIITPYDTRAAFLINWNTPDAGRMVLQLLTPTCDLLTPESVRDGQTPGVSFTNDLRHQLYVIDESYLRNDADPSQPRYGTWQMIVTSPELSDSERCSEQYAYDALVESSLQMQVSLDHDRYYAGDPIGVSAKLTVNGLPITNSAVKLELTMPGQAMANWLAAIPISAQEYEQAAELLSDKDASPIYVKAYAAQLKGFVFDRLPNTATIPMTDPDNHGVYTATFSQTATPDGYRLYVTAVGTTADGVFFRRERALQVIVGVRPDPDFTLFNLLYDTFPRDPRVITAVVGITPRDRFGNVVLIDPATSQDIVLQAEGGRFADKLTTNFDGTYTTSLVYDAGATPIISLEVAGEAVFKGRLIAPVDQLAYADQVLDFKPGTEDEPGVNQHINPKDALGDIRQKEQDRFVSLGAYGSLTVGIQEQAILAQGDDDVTVFVQPDKDMRPYLVEALPAGARAKWVELGASPGITQSFGLGQANLKAAQAIRITDESGRTRGGEFKPISTPGVSIRGVGFKKVGPKPGIGCLELLLGIIGWLRRPTDQAGVSR